MCLLLRFVLACAAASACAVSSLAAQPGVLAITHVNVIPMDRAGVRRDRTVLIRNGLIVAVAPAAAVRVPAGAMVVDGRGRYLIPGLWDMHVHTVANPDTTLGLEREARGWTFPLLVANGVTHVRDMGAVLDTIVALRRALAADSAAPRLVIAGALLDGPTPWGAAARHAWTVRTPGEARAAVDSLRRAGVDFIKVHDFLSTPAFFAAAAEARRVGLPLAGHLRPEVSPAEAADSGQVSFEHLAPELPAYCAPSGRERARGFYAAWIASRGMAAYYAGVRRLWETREPRSCAALFAHLRRDGVWIDPTLVLRMQARAAGPDTALLTPAGKAACRAALGDLRGVPAAELASADRAMAAEVRALHAAGLRFLAGTDSPGGCLVPGFSLHAELRELVRAGLTPREALAAATIGPARFLGAADSLGSVAPGRAADLVLLDADPLRDIGNTRRIAGVVLRGRWMPRTSLDALIERARRTAAGR